MSSLKEKTAKGLFWGGMSNGVQQLLSLVFGLFLARLLSPGEYGMVGMLAIFSAIASSLCNSGFVVSLINRKTIRYEDYNSVFLFSFGVALSCYVILFVAAPLIADFYHQPELVKLSRWSFLGFVIASTSISPSAHLIKTMKIKEKSIAEIVALFVSGVVGVMLALKGFSYWSIVVQTLLFAAIRSFLYWYFDDWKPSLKWDPAPVKEMLRFGFKLLITSLFSIFNSYLFTLILGRYYSEKEVGHYNQASKWSTMGSSLVSGMITSIAQPVLVEVEDTGERQLRVFRKMVRFTAFVSFPAMFGLSFVAPEFIEIAITAKWLPSAQILRVLAISGAFLPLAELFSYMVLSKGDSTAYMWSTISLFIVLLPAVLFAHSGGIMLMIEIYALINILWLGVWFLLVRHKIGYTFFQMLKDIVPFLGITALIIFVVYWLTLSITNIYWLFISKVLLVAGLYVLVMHISKSVILSECIQYVKDKLFHRRVG